MYKYVFTPTVHSLPWTIYSIQYSLFSYFTIKIDFRLKFHYEGMKQEIPKTDEDTPSEANVLEESSTTKDKDEKQDQEQKGISLFDLDIVMH